MPAYGRGKRAETTVGKAHSHSVVPILRASQVSLVLPYREIIFHSRTFGEHSRVEKPGKA